MTHIQYTFTPSIVYQVPVFLFHTLSTILSTNLFMNIMFVRSYLMYKDLIQCIGRNNIPQILGKPLSERSD